MIHPINFTRPEIILLIDAVTDFRRQCKDITETNILEELDKLKNKLVKHVDRL